MLSYAAKWLGDKKVYFDSVQRKSEKAMIKTLHKLMSDATIIVGYHSTAFDFKWINRVVLLHGLKPIPLYNTIDVCTAVKSNFKMMSYRLDYVCQKLGLGGKVPHSGMYDLALRCEEGCRKSWRTVKGYNIQDTVLTERLYVKVKPFIKNHPNMNVYTKSIHNACPSCLSANIRWKEYFFSNYVKYIRNICKDCGKSFKGARAA